MKLDKFLKPSKFSREDESIYKMYNLTKDYYADDYVLYKKYLQGNTDDFNQYDYMNTFVLSLLQQLGFNMAEVGTYFYKDVILKTISYLNVDNPNYGEIIAQVNNEYSSLYHDISRNEKDVGVSTFHLCIKKAINNISAENIDANLYDEIFSRAYNMDYKARAYVLANYALDNQIVRRRK